jgi:hypothetical protein
MSAGWSLLAAAVFLSTILQPPPAARMTETRDEFKPHHELEYCGDRPQRRHRQRPVSFIMSALCRVNERIARRRIAIAGSLRTQASRNAPLAVL